MSGMDPQMASIQDLIGRVQALAGDLRSQGFAAEFDGGGTLVITVPGAPLYPRDCGHCGVWTCLACGWKRRRAALARPGLQECARCGGTSGSMQPTRHGARRWGMCNR